MKHAYLIPNTKGVELPSTGGMGTTIFYIIGAVLVLGAGISIIIPVYNLEKKLRRCLDTVLAQSIENYEVLLVDDGSTDNSGRICEEYVGRDKRFHYALTQKGGIYLDTDMELLRPLDSFLKHNAFVGTEDGYHVSMGIIGMEAGASFFKSFMDEYGTRSFYGKDGSIDTTTIVQTMTNRCLENGYNPGNRYQEILGLVIYPSEYFYPLSNIDGIMRKTKNTSAIHWFSGSWVPEDLKRQIQRSKMRKKIKATVIKMIGERNFELVLRFLNNWTICSPHGTMIPSRDGGIALWVENQVL